METFDLDGWDYQTDVYDFDGYCCTWIGRHASASLTVISPWWLFQPFCSFGVERSVTPGGSFLPAIYLCSDRIGV